MLTFRDKVIQITKRIPLGKVTTYGTVAALAGLPRGARLIGGILHASTEKLPWYRVINRHGFISIRRLGCPKELQKSLLESEGIAVSQDFMVDLDEYGWFG